MNEELHPMVRCALALESIAASLEKMANPVVSSGTYEYIFGAASPVPVEDCGSVDG